MDDAMLGLFLIADFGVGQTIRVMCSIT